MTTFDWRQPALSLRFVAEDGAPVRLVDAAPTLPAVDEERYRRVHQPLVEVVSPAHGQAAAGPSQRHTGTQLGRGLRYAGHHTARRAGVEVLVVE